MLARWEGLAYNAGDGQPIGDLMADENPILNNPYEEPEGHYATNLAGELDYSKPVKGRRVFTPEIQTIPVRQGAQEELMELNEVAGAQYGSHAVNLLRREVSAWRNEKYPQTTRITRELLQFWFLNPERDMTLSLFFAQREAIETAIWLNEVAEKSNVGQHILRELEKAQAVSSSAENNLPRVAFKMATGTGKTVVMAALIAYHYFNRAEYRNDVRFADNFLILAPGITIRDRLGVLRVDTRGGIDAEDYYHTRYLVPKAWRKKMAELNKRLVITNYRAFEPKTLQGNKRSPFDGKIRADGTRQEAKEDHSQVLGRLLAGFRPGSRLLVINDEAHHCYLPKEDERRAEGEDSEKENERAAVWFSGLVRVAQRYKVRSVYDLSATPYFLTGSGCDPYTLFPWTVSDFGLIEAIESGLVKIPFLPTRDDTQELELPVLRNLYEHVRDGLPKAGRKKQKARAREEGKTLDDLTDEGHALAWVKNAFLDFRIPYTDRAGEQRDYYPDFIVRSRLAGGRLITLLVEVTGFNQDKEEKRWTVLHRWLPAVNSIAPKRAWLKWDGCGYFLATRKALKNQVILHNVALGMVGKSGVIEARTRYPQV